MPGTILSYPSFIAHVDADREQDTNFNELISSADERVEITLMTSTIVQFDDVDFGVDRCELQLRYDFDDNLDDQAFSIFVYQLDIAAHLDAPPQRRDRVDIFQVTPGTAFDWRNSFSCSWGERLTFEFACSDARSTSSNCLMEWWQRRNEEDPNKGGCTFPQALNYFLFRTWAAIFMLQYPS
ncbi:hypothetical protein CPB84DRAFT_787814 [Gymnopilus junonius]|uniref:Ubiquitin 3 binding protein But2 C-terminal domain-containing protein n=1 Tax=Gymnopilus junonius TaxID=109634 RepID=A0A9P5TPT7_GYMJU|nr:hypothetical protein CPB84DRAFT_787814 [Gymnopilus junonius]